ncbi:hypothetical protein Tco_1568676 [Tanacetum coccineum]
MDDDEYDDDEVEWDPSKDDQGEKGNSIRSGLFTMMCDWSSRRRMLVDSSAHSSIYFDDLGLIDWNWDGMSDDAMILQIT